MRAHIALETCYARTQGPDEPVDTTRTNLQQRPDLPRKLRLDCDRYRQHSVRACAGDAHCDHDFEAAPTMTEADFAVWHCTRCGREFKYETWRSGASAASDPSTRSL